jgi:murein DD-endopeptidase MepM/ murein hydrolase activator NlpD
MNIKFTGKATLFISIFCLAAASCTNSQNEIEAVEEVTTATFPAPTASPLPTDPPIPDGYVEYFTQSGDTLPAVAAHFGVDQSDIQSEDTLDAVLIIDPGTRLLVPDVFEETTPSEILFPDAAIVFSPEAVDFDVQAFADEQGGYLSTHTMMMTRGTTLASEIIAQLALDYSINPRILLALLEAESGWVSRMPEADEEALYPFGFIRTDRANIYMQTGLAIRRLSQGYYDWRAGIQSELIFPDGTTLRLAPSLNAGTVAVLNFFAQVHNYEDWEKIVYGEKGIRNTYETLFGDPWERVVGLDPLFPTGVIQPEMNLPFSPNEKWNYTCGPHDTHYLYHYRKEKGPAAALDFAPPLAVPGCGNSVHWTTAAAAGRVVRVGNGLVVLDLDKDGYEQSGWVLVYMHVANSHRVGLDAYLETDDIIGHPSCEGGSSSGIHIHIMRKYNGEWVLADGGLPFVLSGYRASRGEDYCGGSLDNGEKVISAFPWGNYLTAIYRPDSEPEYLYTPTPKP